MLTKSIIPKWPNTQSRNSNFMWISIKIARFEIFITFRHLEIRSQVTWPWLIIWWFVFLNSICIAADRTAAVVSCRKEMTCFPRDSIVAFAKQGGVAPKTMKLPTSRAIIVKVRTVNLHQILQRFACNSVVFGIFNSVHDLPWLLSSSLEGLLLSRNRAQKLLGGSSHRPP